MSDDVLVRSAAPEEISSYVLPTWLNSYALGFVGKLMRADSRHGPGREAYWSQQRAKIERILSTPTVRVRVALLDNEPIGWICDDEVTRRIHYVFVNRVFRRQGISKLLIPSWYDDPRGGTVYLTHLPPPWYSRGDAAPWLGMGHVCIDLVSAC